ncbi:tyrosine-type recombinase/integrase [Profundibacter amoris]|nr:tyrosine-type recombinase/integrase [Profundibacter amoris]
MTAAIDFTKNAKLLKAPPGMYRHDGDRFPSLYLNVGKRRSTWYLKKRVSGKVKSIKVGAFPEMDAVQASKQGDIKSKQVRTSPDITTVRDGWDKHCDTSQAMGSMSDRHRIDMTTKLERHAGDILKMHVADVTSARIQDVVNGLAKDGMKATARHVRTGLGSAFNYANVPNPVAGKKVRAPSSGETETKWTVACAAHGLDEDDWSPMWDAIMGVNNALRRTAWIVMLFTGIRAGNVRSLRWDQVDLQLKTIHLPKMKNKLARTLPICDIVVSALMAIRSSEFEFVFPASSKTGHIDQLDVLTTTIEGNRVPVLSQHDTRRHFMQAGAEAFLPDYVIHFLRGDVSGGKGNDMLMKYMKRMGNHRAPSEIETVIVQRIKVTPSFDLEE